MSIFDSPSLLFLSVTPNSEPKKKWLKIENSTDRKIKIVEKTGNTIKNVERVSISDDRKCESEQCLICRTSKKENCRKAWDMYWVKDHIDDLKKKGYNSVLYRHYIENTKKKEPSNFKMKIRNIFGQDATLRKVTEVITIKT